MKKTIFSLAIIAILASCNSKNKISTIETSPSNGSTLQLNGGAGESDAENIVFVDFSAEKQTPILRKSWDLGFNCGAGFNVLLNNSIGATAIVIDKTDMNTVGIADTTGKRIAMGFPPLVTDMSLVDNVDGNLSQTVIPAVSANAAENKVIVINRNIPGSAYMKVRVLRNSDAGYTLQYADLAATTFHTVQIAKDNNYNFKYFSFDNKTVSVEPEKKNWDIVWGKFMYKAGSYPYSYSDMIAINNLGGVSALERTYSNEKEALAAYQNFNKDSVAKYTFSTEKWTIGSKWRRTAQPGSPNPAGVIKTKFFVLKDAQANLYKLRFISFTGEDGGTRGKPELKYELIKQ